MENLNAIEYNTILFHNGSVGEYLGVMPSWGGIIPLTCTIFAAIILISEVGGVNKIRRY